VRFCTERYQKPNPSNLSTSCMHLTNYALNKYNANFHFNTSATETNKVGEWECLSLSLSLSLAGVWICFCKECVFGSAILSV
jgi:hypothetical protein